MSADILFVDDDPDILKGFQYSLKNEFKIDTACGAREALARLRDSGPYAVVVSDMEMPEMSGIQFLMESEKTAPDTVRLMLTGNVEQKTARDAVNQGHVFRFLSKPCPKQELVPVLRASLKQYQLVTAERDVLERTLNGSARVLSDILATHDAHAFGKSQRLIEYMRALAVHLRLKRTWDLELAAMLSQIGCVTIPQAVLERRHFGSSLSEAEADMLTRIPQIGHNLLSHIPRLESVAAAVLYQNKNFDGSGFPQDAVAGEKIPLGARMLRVLQDWAGHEPAKVSRDKALENMKLCSGRYDPGLLGAMKAVFDICPEHTASAEIENCPVGIKDLRVGWTLSAEARTRNGMCIVPAGTRISPMLMEKLRNFAKLDELEEPIQVRNPTYNL